jgi:hypothetical protein
MPATDLVNLSANENNLNKDLSLAFVGALQPGRTCGSTF